MPGFLKEKELYIPVKEYFVAAGFDVRGEVGACDVAAMADGELVVAELKLTLNLDVILQASERQKCADRVYIAVPEKPKAMRSSRWRSICGLLKRLGIGLLVVRRNAEGDAAEEVIPALESEGGTSGRSARKRKKLVREFCGRSSDYNTGGASRSAIVTVYREKALRVADLLRDRDLTAAELIKAGSDKKKHIPHTV